MRRLIPFAALAVGLLVAAVAAAAHPQHQVPGRLTPESLVGSDSYNLYCSSCHGEDAKGHGPVAPALKTAPADLTRIACRNGGTYPVDDVREYIDGHRRVTAHGTPDMPVWGATLRGLDASEGRVRVRIDNLAAYIGSLQVKAKPDAACTAGGITPAP